MFSFFLKRLITFECSVNGKIKYLTYNELKDCWGYFFFIRQPFEEIDGKKTFRKNTLKDIKNAVEKAYSEDPVIYSKSQDYEDLTGCLLEFSGDHIIVTNKELKFSFDKFFLLPSNKEEKEYGFTFEGDYKDRFGTLTNQHLGIAPNINHPFIQLVNKNRDMFTGKDKEDHEFYIETLLEMKTITYYLMPLKEIQSIQKNLLDFYMEKGILTKEEAERYVLTEKDFCPYDMDEDFLKQ
jgi:hypothetical protein